MRYPPHDYQKEGIRALIEHGSMGLILDPGLGKTSMIYAAFHILRKQGLVENMLVIAPKRVSQSVWPAEAQKWDEFKDLKVVVLHGPKKDELLCSDADVFVINPEGLPWLFKAMQGAPGWWDILVVDESTKFKHSNTQRFKMIKHYLPKFKRRYILTGSPIPNGYLDLFGQIYILDLGRSLGRFITHYRMNYFYTPYEGSYVWLPKHGAIDAINAKIAPLTLRMSEKDYLKLPPLIHNTVEIDLPNEARNIYDSMEDSLVAEINENIILAVNAGAAMTKCRQIANGGIYHEGGETWDQIHDAKVDALEDLVEELSGKPALVAYEYKHDLDRIRRRLGREVPYIGGGVSLNRFREIEQEWNKGNIPVLLAQPQSVAHGLNLQGTGAAVIYFSIPYDYEIYDQLFRRVWRQGQKEKVFLHHLVARGTVDEVAMKMLERKCTTQEGLFQALRTHLLRRLA